MEIIFHSHANKTHFHKKGCAPSLILKVRDFWNSEVAYFIEFFSKLTSGSVFLGTSRYEAKAGCFQIVMFNEVHQWTAIRAGLKHFLPLETEFWT